MPSIQKNKNLNELSYKIIGAAMEVHKELGPGLLESIYQKALAHELQTIREFNIQLEKPINVIYKSQNLNQGFRLDILVENQIIIELKSVAEISDLHKKQLLTYLKLTNKNLGLLINFNCEVLRDGITRIINTP